MKTAHVIDIAAYQKAHEDQPPRKIPAPISNELALAIQQLILRLKESNPLKKKR